MSMPSQTNSAQLKHTSYGLHLFKRATYYSPQLDGLLGVLCLAKCSHILCYDDWAIWS